MGNKQRRLAAAAAARRRRIVTIGFLAVVVGGAGVWFFATRPTGYVGSYETSAEIVPVPEEEGSAGPPANGWRIIFDSRWNGDEDRPNKASQCYQDVLTEDGTSLQSKPFGLYTGNLVEKGIYTPHLLKTGAAEGGLPVEARIECDPVLAGTYVVTNADVVKGWTVGLDARWDGGAAPPISSCVADFYDSEGEDRELIESADFDAELGRERHGMVIPGVMVLAGDVPAPPEVVEVRCEPATE